MLVLFSCVSALLVRVCNREAGYPVLRELRKSALGSGKFQGAKAQNGKFL
jgi:hypothetical protein